MYAGPRRSSRLATREAARLGTRPMADSGRSGPEPLGERRPDSVELVGAEVRQQLAEGAYELVGGAYPLVEADQPGGEVAAPAEDHADPPAVGQPVVAARVGERPRPRHAGRSAGRARCRRRSSA